MQIQNSDEYPHLLKTDHNGNTSAHLEVQTNLYNCQNLNANANPEALMKDGYPELLKIDQNWRSKLKPSMQIQKFRELFSSAQNWKVMEIH